MRFSALRRKCGKPKTTKQRNDCREKFVNALSMIPGTRSPSQRNIRFPSSGIRSPSWESPSSPGSQRLVVQGRLGRLPDRSEQDRCQDPARAAFSSSTHDLRSHRRSIPQTSLLQFVEQRFWAMFCVAAKRFKESEKRDN